MHRRVSDGCWFSSTRGARFCTITILSLWKLYNSILSSWRLYNSILGNFFNDFIFHVQIISECYKAEQWLREIAQQQDSLPKNTDPILWSGDIKRRTEDLKLYYSCAFNFHFRKFMILLFYYSSAKVKTDNFHQCLCPLSIWYLIVQFTNFQEQISSCNYLHIISTGRRLGKASYIIVKV